jgi:acyl-CoA synthetase (AMP-forming)/AMP-acid ligase II
VNLSELWTVGDPASPAIADPGGPWLSYSQLRERIDRIGEHLTACGIRAEHRIAVVLPNGPEMATALLAIMSRCAAVPLNPALGEPEIDALF